MLFLDAAHCGLTGAVRSLRERYVSCFNRWLPRAWETSAAGRERHRSILAARGNTSGPDEVLLQHLIHCRFEETDARARDLIQEAQERKVPWVPATLR